MQQIIILLFLGTGIPFLFFMIDASSLKWLIWGAKAWGVSIIIKAFLGIVISAISHRCLSTERGIASAWGIWSACCEIGTSAYMFLYLFQTHIKPRLQDVIGFGVGAGSLETLLLCIIYFYSYMRKTSENQPILSKDPFVLWGMVFERISYLCGYIGARGLVWIGVSFWFLVPVLALPLFSFALIDGVSAYGQAKGWNWSDPQVCRKFYSLHFSVVSVQILVFFLCIFGLYYFGKI